MSVSSSFESDLRSRGYQLIAGIDEAGRGPLAGPVVAAAVILPLPAGEDCNPRLPGLDDSKKLTTLQRETLAVQIRSSAVSFAIGEASPREIDRMNILEASKLAMRRAVMKLKPAPDFLLLDAVTINVPEIPQLALIKGDARCASIAAASILAKVHRDALMVKLAKKYPVYGFERHFGYPTTAHYAALQQHGFCPVHRQSFRLGA